MSPPALAPCHPCSGSSSDSVRAAACDSDPSARGVEGHRRGRSLRDLPGPTSPIWIPPASSPLSSFATLSVARSRVIATVRVHWIRRGRTRLVRAGECLDDGPHGGPPAAPRPSRRASSTCGAWPSCSAPSPTAGSMFLKRSTPVFAQEAVVTGLLAEATPDLVTRVAGRRARRGLAPDVRPRGAGAGRSRSTRLDGRARPPARRSSRRGRRLYLISWPGRRSRSARSRSSPRRWRRSRHGCPRRHS